MANQSLGARNRPATLYASDMPCVFCGRSPLTNEHVFPRWLNRYLPQDRRQQIEISRYGQNGYDIVHPSIGIDIRVRKVCAECNSGWMSKLEADSIPVLEPLVSTTALQLVSVREQRQIALWATKTAMMADLTQAEPLILANARRRLRTHHAIPGGTRIWLGACGELYPIATSHTVRLELERLDNPSAPREIGFYVPLKIGHMCLYVYFPGVDVVVRHPPEYHLSLARIWPRRSSNIAWPPPLIPQDGVAFEQFSDDFWRSFTMLPREIATAHDVRDSP